MNKEEEFSNGPLTMVNKEKVRRLSHAARFGREGPPIYSAKAGGKTVPLLKTLLNSHCQNECLFCANRHSRSCPRYAMEPEEMANLALKLHKKGSIQGVFLSSALSSNPDVTSQKEVETIKILREKGYRGYVHLRLMPGCSRDTIQQAARIADRIGINLEAPTQEIYNDLKVSDVFDYNTGILKRMEWISNEYEKLDNSKPYGNLSAGIDTQFIVGATRDHDKTFLKMTDSLYRKLNLQRVYFSAFEPVPRTPLADRPTCSKKREHRLYKASFLLRDYDFSYDDLVYDVQGNLVEEDPKKAFAKAHEELFPVAINSASYNRLLQIPGVGPVTAQKIIDARPITSLAALKEVGHSRITESLPFIDFPHTTLYQFIK